MPFSARDAGRALTPLRRNESEWQKRKCSGKKIVGGRKKISKRRTKSRLKKREAETLVSYYKGEKK